MPRPEKVQAVADIKERIENARAVFLAEYAGLSVPQQQKLRRELKANGAEFKVVKMTLARLAAAQLDIDTLDEHLLGPTGLAIADGDAVAAAKVLKDFAGANEVFKVKGGLLGLEYLSPERVSELADIEPRDVLLAKLAGAFAAPMANVAGLVSALQRDVVGLVQALADKREASGEVAAPAAAAESEPTSAEDPVEEAPASEASTEEALSEESSGDDAAAAAEAPDEEALVDDAAADAADAEDTGDPVEDEPQASPESADEESAPEASADAAGDEDEKAKSTPEVADAADDAEEVEEVSETAPSEEGDDEDQDEEAEEE